MVTNGPRNWGAGFMPAVYQGIRFQNGAVGSIVNTCALGPGQGSPQNLNGAVHIVGKGVTAQVGAGGATFMLPERQRQDLSRAAQDSRGIGNARSRSRARMFRWPHPCASSDWGGPPW